MPDKLKDVLAMEPRARDAAVAERVLGWKRYTFETNTPRAPERRYWLDDPSNRRMVSGAGIVDAPTDIEPYGDAFGRVPPSSTDAAADLSVLHHVRDTYDNDFRERMEWWLQRVIGDRRGGNWLTWDRAGLGMIFGYVVGDYSIAALVTATERLAAATGGEGVGRG